MSGNGVDYVGMLFDIQAKLVHKARHKLKLIELAAMLGYTATSAVSQWFDGAQPVQTFTQWKIKALNDMLDGKIAFPAGVVVGGPWQDNAREMRKWQEVEWAKIQTREDCAQDRVADAMRGFSLKHVIKAQDQMGEQLDRVEKAVMQIGAALGELLKEWRTERKDGV